MVISPLLLLQASIVTVEKFWPYVSSTSGLILRKEINAGLFGLKFPSS